MTQTLPTQNEGYGFFGTCRAAGLPQHEAWNIAMRQLTAMNYCSAEACRLFLDSRDGRHFADEVVNQGGAKDLEGGIARALVTHLNWKARGRNENYLFAALADYQAEATANSN